MKKSVLSVLFLAVLVATASPAMAKKRHGHHLYQQQYASLEFAPQFSGGMGFGGGSALVDAARRHIGGNPTGRSSLWCATFMDMMLRQTGHRGGGNVASGYVNYGTRVPGPVIGAIMFTPNGGPTGHVGVVSAIAPNGNPIVISGNHKRRVAESEYPRRAGDVFVIPN